MEKDGVFGDIGLVKLKEEDKHYTRTNNILMSSLHGENGIHCNVVAIYENPIIDIPGKETIRFLIHKCSYARMVRKRPSVCRKKLFAWYCTTRDRVIEIIRDGFSFCDIETNGLYGIGIYLHKYGVESGIMSMTDDKDGLRYMLLCSLVMGNMEEIHLGSKQSSPSSGIYDSGVDSLALPKRYTVWCANMNTNIWPLSLVCLKFPCGSTGIQHPTLKHMLPKLESALKTRLLHILPPDIFCLLQSYCRDYKENKISQQHMEECVELIVRCYSFLDVIKYIKSQGYPTLESGLVQILPLTTISVINKYYRLFQEKKLSEQQMEQHFYSIVGNYLLVTLVESTKAACQPEEQGL